MFDQEFLTMAIRLVVAVVLCGVIGFEREIQDKPAGLRTHILVGVGSCTMMLFALYGFQPYLSMDDQYQFDFSRIPAYIISGIGFLGVGAIVSDKNKVKGLTTGASVWTTAGLGLVIGVGMYDLAILVTVLVVLSLFVLRKIEEKF